MWPVTAWPSWPEAAPDPARHQARKDPNHGHLAGPDFTRREATGNGTRRVAAPVAYPTSPSRDVTNMGRASGCICASATARTVCPGDGCRCQREVIVVMATIIFAQAKESPTRFRLPTANGIYAQ